MLGRLIDLWAKRGLPRDAAGFRAVKGSYGQFGEDAVLAWLFDAERRRGRYLDLGCHHPARWSNTYHFYLRGWSGLAVDASPRYRREWARMRPRDTHRVAAVVPEKGDRVAAFRDDDASPATSRIELAPGGGGGPGVAGLDVLAASALGEWWPWEEGPDLVSCDLEGCDRAVLMAYPLAEYGPEVFAVELGETGEGDPCCERLRSFGYRLAARVGVSWIWARGAIGG